MTDPRAAAKAWLSREPLRHADMLDALYLGAEVIGATGEAAGAAGDGAVMLMLEELCYISADSAEAAFALPPLPARAWGATLHETYLLPMLTEKGGFHTAMVCRQGAYMKKTPLPVVLPQGGSIRPLTRADLPYLSANYKLLGDDENHLATRIDAGMLGACLGGKLVGFIGSHAEGGIGMLFIAPEARRMGLAAALESAMVNRFLAEGRLPFGHVETKNEASLLLQQSLGMSFWDGIVYWLIKKT